MANIPDGSFKAWQDTQTMHAADYVQERDMMKAAVNDNDARLLDLETSISAVSLGNAQLQKITDNNGYPLITLTQTVDDILNVAKSSGAGSGIPGFGNGSGFKTILSSAGVSNNPSSNPFKGLMYNTANDSEAFVFGTDSTGVMYVNTLSSGTWQGWKRISGPSLTDDSGGQLININSTNGDILGAVVAAGVGLRSFYAVLGSVNNPASGASIRGIAHLTDSNNGYVFALDFNGGVYLNTYKAGVWQGWKNILDSNAGTSLWEGIFYPTASQVVSVPKALSKCRTGWELIWSDYDAGSPGTANDLDFAVTRVPKYMASKFSGKAMLHAVPSGLNTSTSTVINKRLFITDTTITGHDDNNASGSGTNDVCLRAVLEY